MSLSHRAADRRNWTNPKAECEGSEEWHGTRYGYLTHNCRGDACKAANAAYKQLLRGGQRPGPAWASSQVNYVVNPIWEPDTLTRGELMRERGMA